MTIVVRSKGPRVQSIKEQDQAPSVVTPFDVSCTLPGDPAINVEDPALCVEVKADGLTLTLADPPTCHLDDPALCVEVQRDLNC